MGRKTKARLRSPLSGQPLRQIDSRVGDQVDSLSDHSLTTSFNMPAAHRQSARFRHRNALSLLQPITSFSPMQGRGGDAAITGGLSANMNSGIVRNSTVIEILIRLLCQQREAEPKRREMLFRALCNVIEQCNTSLYSPLHAYPQLQDFQTNLLEKFEMLFEKAQNEIPSNSASIAVPSLNLPRSLFSHSALPSFYHVADRYAQEFIEMEVLGRGAFGVVVKAQNRLDGCFYAIKIITMDQGDSSDNNSLLREVQALARLNHPHIVRYHSTWAQCYVLPPHLGPSDQPTKKLERRLRRPTSAITKPKVSSIIALPGVRITELTSSSEGEESDEETSGGVSFLEENVLKNKTSNTTKVPRTCSVVYEESEEINCNDSSLEIEGSKKEESVGSQSFQKNLEFVNRRKKSNGSSYLPIAVKCFNFKKFSSKENLHTKSSSDESVVFYDNSQNNSDSEIKTSFLSQSKKLSSSSSENFLDTSSEKDAVAVLSHSRCSSLSSYEACKESIIPYHPLANRVQQRHSCIPQMTLFIQMGLCGESLKDWLLRRIEIHTHGLKDKQSSVDRSECLGLFKQLLLAIQYIHSQNIIHRDIKPANIFFTLDGSHIQLGDFGLARPLPDVVASENKETHINLDQSLTPVSEHAPNTHGVGTPIYAAPELRIGQYDNKSDMHNVGIILLELFQPFQTGSERIHVIDSLKSKRHLDQDLIISSPDIAPWILKLTDPEPGKRPSASEVLESSLFRVPTLEEPHQLYHTQHIDIRGSSSITVQRSEAQQSFYSFVKLEEQEKGSLKEKSKDGERTANENAKLKEENLKLKEMIAKLQEQIEKKNSSEANKN